MCYSRPLHEGVDWNEENYVDNDLKAGSPSSWGRGLKSRCRIIFEIVVGRPLHEGVDWNIARVFPRNASAMSPSSWGRGLKWYDEVRQVWQGSSPSSWGRGLKSAVKRLLRTDRTRRPLHEGVDWNVDGKSDALWPRTSPSSWGRGLKFRMILIQQHIFASPSSWGRGLKLNKQ